MNRPYHSQGPVSESNKHYIQDIEKIVRGMANESPIKIVKMSPEDRDGYKKTLEETILSDGVKIIIADKECGITHHRTVSREERATNGRTARTMANVFAVASSTTSSSGFR